MATLGKWLARWGVDGQTCTRNTRIVDVGGGCWGVDFRRVWRTDARVVGGADAWDVGVDCCLSGGGIVGGCADGFVPTFVVAWWRLFGVGVHIFGRDISDDGDDRVGATPHDVVSLHLLYGTLH